MKKIVWLLFISCVIYHQAQGVVKTFVNNSSKSFLIRIYDGNNNSMGVQLQPGGIQDVFISSNMINKIVVIDAKHNSKVLSPVSRHELRKDTAAINDNAIFIIGQNSSIKMYKGSTSRDEMLEKIDEAYTKRTNLPTIDLSIHTMQDNQPWTTQKISYNLKHKTSFLASIESLFS